MAKTREPSRQRGRLIPKAFIRDVSVEGASSSIRAAPLLPEIFHPARSSACSMLARSRLRSSAAVRGAASSDERISSGRARRVCSDGFVERENSIEIECFAPADNDGTFDDVLQFADIAGPMVRPQSPDTVRRQFHRGAAGLTGKAAYKRLGQGCDVAVTLSQRRHPYREDIQTVIEIFTEPPARRPPIAGLCWSQQ